MAFLGPFTIRGPFGRRGDGRGRECGCHGCCGKEWDEFPQTIYARIQSNWSVASSVPPIDIYTTMEKLPPRTVLCVCNNLLKLVEYSSRTIDFRDNGYPAEHGDTCCVSISLSGTCAESGQTDPYEIDSGACYWSASMSWTGGDPLGITLDVTDDSDNPGHPDNVIDCNSMAGGFSIGGLSNVPTCVLDADPLGIGNAGVIVTFSTTAPVGSNPATTCNYICCEPADTLYATITAPGCAVLDGRVVELVRTAGGLTWRGTFGSCCDECGEFEVLAQTDTYSQGPPDTSCSWSIVINVDASTCYSANVSDDAPNFCPPVQVSGSWQTSAGCNDCCAGGTTVTVDLTE